MVTRCAVRRSAERGEARCLPEPLHACQGLPRASVLWREDDLEQSQVRASLSLDDDAVIHMTYQVVTNLTPGGFRRIVSEKKGSKIGKEDAPVNWPVVTSPRFETSDPRYRWITEYQCIGYGLVQIIQSEVRRLTYDVYAMS